MSRIIAFVFLVILVGCAGNARKQASESLWHGPWNASDAERVVQDVFSASQDESWKSTAQAFALTQSNDAYLQQALAQAFKTTAPTKESFLLDAQLQSLDSSATQASYKVTVHINNPQGQLVWTAVRVIQKTSP